MKGGERHIPGTQKSGHQKMVGSYDRLYGPNYARFVRLCPVRDHNRYFGKSPRMMALTSVTVAPTGTAITLANPPP